MINTCMDTANYQVRGGGGGWTRMLISSIYHSAVANMHDLILQIM